MEDILKKLDEVLKTSQENNVDIKAREERDVEFREYIVENISDTKINFSKMEKLIEDNRRALEGLVRVNLANTKDGSHKETYSENVSRLGTEPGPSRMMPAADPLDMNIICLDPINDGEYSAGLNENNTSNNRDIIYINSGNRPHPTETFSSEKEVCPINFLSTLEVKINRERPHTSFKATIKKHLLNEAYYWFIVHESCISNFNDFKNKFLNEFWSVERQEFVSTNLETGKYKYKAEVSRVQYVYALVARVRSLTHPPDEQTIVRKLARHFDPNFLLWFEMRKPKTVSELVSLMKDHEKFNTQVGEAASSKLNLFSLPEDKRVQPEKDKGRSQGNGYRKFDNRDNYKNRDYDTRPHNHNRNNNNFNNQRNYYGQPRRYEGNRGEYYNPNRNHDRNIGYRRGEGNSSGRIESSNPHDNRGGPRPVNRQDNINPNTNLN